MDSQISDRAHHIAQHALAAAEVSRGELESSKFGGWNDLSEDMKKKIMIGTGVSVAVLLVGVVLLGGIYLGKKKQS